MFNYQTHLNIILLHIKARSNFNNLLFLFFTALTNTSIYCNPILIYYFYFKKSALELTPSPLNSIVLAVTKATTNHYCT